MDRTRLGFTTILRRISSCTRSSIQHGTCPIIRPPAVAKRREDGKYIPVPPEKVERNRDNPDGRNHLCAPPPNVFHPSDTVFCFALGGAT
jgi:hypothetical protein